MVTSLLCQSNYGKSLISLKVAAVNHPQKLRKYYVIRDEHYLKFSQ